MYFRSRRSFLQHSVVAGTLLLLSSFMTAGCGGGSDGLGGSGDPVVTRTINPTVTISWAARSRAVDAPSSALSAAVTITGVNGSSVSFNADRPAGNTNAVTQTYNAPQSIEVSGNPTLTVVFYASQGSTGSVVASATARVAIQDDGSIPTAVTNVQSAISSVEIAAGQSINVGEQKFLAYTAKGPNGEIIAVAAGSAFFTVVDGADKLTVNGEVGKGTAGGIASVIATVDDTASSPVNVTVVSAVKIALVANGQNPQVISLLQLLQARSIVPARFDAIPDPNTLQQYDVLMIGASGNIGTADAAKVEAFLNTGRGAVLLGTAPAVLAGSAPLSRPNSGGGNNLVSIASWFGGIVAMRHDNIGMFSRSNPGNFPLPSGVVPNTKIYEATSQDDMPILMSQEIVNQTTDKIIAGDAYYSGDFTGVGAISYQLPSGGRVYWQFHPYGLNSDYTDKVLSLLIAGTNWTAKR